MAGRTAGCDRCVLMNDRGKERGCALVAGLAGQRCWNVYRRVFAQSRRAVVA